MLKESTVRSGSRLLSLDAFRGFTIAAMIIVNDPGSWDFVYAPLLHAEWHGATPTDLIFPFFLFIVGVSIALAFTKRLEKGSKEGDLLKKAGIRSLKIFALGLFLNLFPDFDLSNIRIPGVLQRIAIVYFICSIIYLKLNTRQQAYLSIAILFLYWMVMTLIPVPGIGEVRLEPGQNLAAWVDSLLIPGRMWQGSWDPEGLLSTIPAIVTGVSGMLIGKIILDIEGSNKKLIWIFFLGFISYLVGVAWGWFFPINKNLWTSSYVLYSSGLAAMGLASCLWVVDYLRYKRWADFGIIYGSNAITIYVFAGMLPELTGLNLGTEADPYSMNSLFFSGLVSKGLSPEFVSLLWAIMYCLVCFIPAYILYKKRIFIKV